MKLSSYMYQGKACKAPFVGALQIDNQLLQLWVISQCITMSATIIGVDESSVSSQHNQIRPSCPSSWAKTLLDGLFKGVREIVPAIAVFIASEE